MANVTRKMSQGSIKRIVEFTFNSAKSTNTINELVNDVNLISKTLFNSKTLRIFIYNPLIEKDLKTTTLNIIFKKSNSNFNIILLSILEVLINNDYLGSLTDIINEFQNLWNTENIVEIAEVQSTLPLTYKQRKSLAEKLKIITGAKKIRLICKLDKTLFGGFALKIGSKLIDTSIKGQLKKMTNLLSCDWFFVNSIL